MANIKNLAADFVLTAPSPATSGTTLVVRSGAGAYFPSAPFYITLTPTGNLSTLGTSEIVLVTAKTSDTFTITRAQKGTTAKTVGTGWIVANGIYAEDLFSSSIQMDQSFTGTIDGTNKVFTTSQAFTSIMVTKNGTVLTLTNDYTITGSNQITFVTAPSVGATLRYTSIQGTLLANSNADMVDGFHANSTPTANTILPLDSSARISKLVISNPYKFSAYPSAALTLPGATATKVPFNTKTFDPNSNFDTTNYRYVAPATGYYQINTQVGIGGAGISAAAYAFILLYKNGAEIKRTGQTSGSGNANTLPRPSIVDLIPLTAGDYIEVFAYCSETRDISNSNNITWFSGFLESAA